MNPDFDITLKDGAGNAPSSKDAFLETLGLDEQSLLGDTAQIPAKERESSADEDLILSSLPDDLGISGPGIAPQRGFNITTSIKIQRPTVEGVSSSEEVEPDQEVSNTTSRSAVEETRVESQDDQDPEETLHLHCPQCRGALVLQRRHLGVEGACVWCHVPIVAAESPGEGRVRVFPILAAGATSLLPTPPTPEETADPSAKEIESEIPVSIAPATISPTKSDGVEKVQPKTAEHSPDAVQPESPSGFSSAFPEISPRSEVTAPSAKASLPSPEIPQDLPEIAFQDYSGFAPVESKSSATSESAPSEIPSGFSGFAQVESKPSAPEETAPAEALSDFSGGFTTPTSDVSFGQTPASAARTEGEPSIPATPDLDELYSVGGFLEASAPETSLEAKPVPASAAAKPIEEPTAPSPSSGFASGFAEPAAADAFAGPTPWGPPTLAPAAPPAAKTKPEAEATPVPAGFMTAGMPDDAPPSAIPDGFGAPSATSAAPEPTPSWEEAFGTPAPAPSPSGFGAIAGPAEEMEEAPSFLSELKTASPEVGSTANHEASPTWMSSPEKSDSLDSFAPPAHGFSTGSSELFEETKDSPVLFGDPGFSAPMPWDDKSPDDAPSALAPVGPTPPKPELPEPAGLGESLFGAAPASPNLFTSAPEAPPQPSAPVEPAPSIAPVGEGP
ncbi:MAG: hypothetical protein KDN18_24365, partial [Verrucomicrobiae bacterium]|nr:hypothetical protein [Verrucomicrobiae bacterium]